LWLWLWFWLWSVWVGCVKIKITTAATIISDHHQQSAPSNNDAGRGGRLLVIGCAVILMPYPYSSAISYKACVRVLRWLQEPPCITRATLRPSPQVKSMDFGLYYDGYEALCVLRSLRNRRRCHIDMGSGLSMSMGVVWECHCHSVSCCCCYCYLFSIVANKVSLMR
jgi:hypothetical protein